MLSNLACKSIAPKQLLVSIRSSRFSTLRTFASMAASDRSTNREASMMQSVVAPAMAPRQPTALSIPAEAPVQTLTSQLSSQLSLPLGGLGAVGNLAHALKSVVKIFTTSVQPNFASPWQCTNQTKSTATGFVVSPISSRRILTNAHAVSNQLQVMLRKHGNAKKFTARVLSVGHECDIAMLTVDEDDFWVDVEALEIQGLPNMQESVMVVGFPQGGDNVCVTKGVVSRLDRQQYSHGRFSLLAIQIDAAINSGNSGGPVLHGDKVVGIAFQCLTAGENIGYIIPTPVIDHFLEDIKKHGHYTGFCELGCTWQTLESGDMKKWLNMPSDLTGVYLTSTEHVFDASKVLKAGDVITHINDYVIADDGTFLFEQSVRIDLRHLVSMAFHGDTTRVKVWREGKHLDLNVKVSTPNQLVPLHSHDVKPKYYIYAGLVFTRLTNFYLRSTYGTDWGSKAPIKLCDRSFAGTMEAEGQEVVLLSKVLSSDVNVGYQDIGNIQVYRVNGVKVHNLAHLAQLIHNCTEDFVRFDLEWKKVIVISHKRALSMTSQILAQNAISAGHSEGLLEEPLNLPSDVEHTHQPSVSDTEEVAGEGPDLVGRENKSKL